MALTTLIKLSAANPTVITNTAGPITRNGVQLYRQLAEAPAATTIPGATIVAVSGLIAAAAPNSPN